uniref:RNase H type-1 domain-containing protein n=1 Tax=Arion vulgaris TaxID=1028688 RepID=A0A0B6YS44_9EUPU
MSVELIHWIHSHCKLKGNEDANRLLAKVGAGMSQVDNLVSYVEAKTIARGHYRTKWEKEQSKYKNNDGY